MFLYLMRSLISFDYLSSGRTAKMGSLSQPSQRILDEYAARFRISADYQAVAYVSRAARAGAARRQGAHAVRARRHDARRPSVP